MHQIPQLHRCVLHGALGMLERSAGKLARSVLRGLGGRESTWLPGALMTWGGATTDESRVRDAIQ